MPHFQEGLSNEYLDRIVRRELKPLHTWHHLSWFLFGFPPCVVLELVMIFTASSSSSKTDFVWKTYCVFYIEGFTDLTFIKRFNLSSFGFMIHCWTMMFLCIFLMSSLLWFQRAKDHQKRSPDAKDIVVLVFGFPAVFQGAVVPPEVPPEHTEAYFQWHQKQ